MIEDKDIRDIQAYLKGILPPNREERFKERLNNDPIFKAKFEDLSPIISALEDIRNENVIKEIITNSEIKLKNDLENERPVPTKIVSLYKKVLTYAAAACFLILLGVAWHDLTLSTRLYQDYYKSESNDSRGKEIEGCPDEVTLELYYQKNYTAFLKKLSKNVDSPCKSYYKGMAFLGLEDSQNAIESLTSATLSDDNIIKQKADWYLALAYLKNKQKDKAKEQLKIILSTHEHQFENGAKGLKDQLENNPILFN